MLIGMHHLWTFMDSKNLEKKQDQRMSLFSFLQQSRFVIEHVKLPGIFQGFHNNSNFLTEFSRFSMIFLRKVHSPGSPSSPGLVRTLCIKVSDKTDYHWNILNESISSYIFLTERHGHWLVVYVLILFLKTASDISSFKEFGRSTQIFGANEERVSLPLYTVFVLFLCNILLFLKL